MTGTLYLCATPIGNLEDMTFRVVRTLKEVDLIAAEDTRNSIKLLNHFDIHTPMTSYHEYNRIEKAHVLVEKLKEGQNIALITDAGTPGISDPGEDLVRICQEEGVSVTSLPGACACVTALTLSGLPTRRFCFEAFLPTEKKDRQLVLAELQETLGDRRLTICRERTKKHETAFATTFSRALAFYQEQEPKGECVLVIEGKSFDAIRKEQQESWESLTIPEHMEHYLSQGIDKKTAMKQVATARGVGKREIYQALLEEE